MKLGKYSFGIGDRFGMEGRAQLKAILRAKELGIDLVPVWNKSNREHQIIGTVPDNVRKEIENEKKRHREDGDRDEAHPHPGCGEDLFRDHG